jgi:aryl carrier-like protein
LRECRNQLSACLVVAKDDRLIAYVQARSPGLAVEEYIKEICRQYLPSSMIPFAVIVLDRFPLNANGKIDRARLPLLVSHVAALPVNDIPRMEFEQELETFWCQLLKTGSIPRDVNLLTLGANSLHFMLATNHYYRQWLSDQVQVDLSILFRQATIAQHAQLLAAHAKTTPTPAIVPSRLPSHLTEGMSLFWFCTSV